MKKLNWQLMKIFNYRIRSNYSSKKLNLLLMSFYKKQKTLKIYKINMILFFKKLKSSKTKLIIKIKKIKTSIDIIEQKYKYIIIIIL